MLPIPDCRRGFSLLEVLLSLVIVSGALVILLRGIETGARLTAQSHFEAWSATYAEREMELLKSDLLTGRRSAQVGGRSSGRFRLPAGWRTTIAWTALDELFTTRLCIIVKQQRLSFQLESHLFLPEGSS